MKPAPVQAQSFVEQLFGRPTLQHRKTIRRSAPQQTTTRKVIRKKVIRKKSAKRSYKKKSYTRKTATRSSSRASKSRSRSVSRGSSYTYRTLCVRKADGYFFPVSFSTTEQYFDQDLEACQARCPGAEVDLYFHRVLREEAEQMVSHSSGDDYTDLPTAFAYKKSGVDRVAAKACLLKPEPAPGMAIAENLGDLPFESPIPMPARRPDPEEVLVSELRGGDKNVAEVSNRDKVIRRVGPRFFPDQ